MAHCHRYPHRAPGVGRRGYSWLVRKWLSIQIAAAWMYAYTAKHIFRTKKKYEFHDSRPYLSFCPDPKHFIVQNEQSIVKMGNMAQKPNIHIKYKTKIKFKNV